MSRTIHASYASPLKADKLAIAISLGAPMNPKLTIEIVSDVV
jgi:hypothetical protein